MKGSDRESSSRESVLCTSRKRVPHTVELVEGFIIQDSQYEVGTDGFPALIPRHFTLQQALIYCLHSPTFVSVQRVRLHCPRSDRQVYFRHGIQDAATKEEDG